MLGGTDLFIFFSPFLYCYIPLILFSSFSFLPDHTGIYLIRWSLLSVSEPFRNSSRLPDYVSKLFLLHFSFIVLLNCPCHSSRLLFLGEVTSRVSVLFMWKCSVTQLVMSLCNPMDCSPPGSSVHEISQARILEWVAISFSRVSSHTRDWTHISCIDEWIPYHWATREAQTKPAAAAKSLQSCLTLCDPVDGSPPGYPVPGVLQARVLEWGAIAFSETKPRQK